jgi:hypothetical protein
MARKPNSKTSSDIVSVSRKSNKRLSLGRTHRDAAFPAAPAKSQLPSGYAEVLADLKQRIGQERLRTVLAAAWPDKAIVQGVIAQIPWRSNIARVVNTEILPVLPKM